MLDEARPADFDSRQAAMQTQNLDILNERKATFSKQNFEVQSIISLRQIERYLHIGLVGRLDLPTSLRWNGPCWHAGRSENLIEKIGLDEDRVNIYLIDETLPSATFRDLSAAPRQLRCREPISTRRTAEYPYRNRQRHLLARSGGDV